MVVVYLVQRLQEELKQSKPLIWDWFYNYCIWVDITNDYIQMLVPKLPILFDISIFYLEFERLKIPKGVFMGESFQE